MCHVPSPNFDAAATVRRIDLLVIHNISLPPGEFGGTYIADLFRTGSTAMPILISTSCARRRYRPHFLIRRDGEVVCSSCRPTTAPGMPAFRRFADVSAATIFLSASNSKAPTSSPSKPSNTRCSGGADRALRDALSDDDVAGHEHIAPGRKTDPGPCFDWEHFRKSLIRKGVAGIDPSSPSLSGISAAESQSFSSIKFLPLLYQKGLHRPLGVALELVQFAAVDH